MNAKFFLISLMAVLVIILTNCTKQEPIASFSVDNASIAEGESVQFTDQSLNNPTSWEWTFEGGSPASSSAQNPSVTYADEGKYQVSLMATNDGGTDAVIRENCITVSVPPPPPPIAAFTSDKTTISTGTTVYFSDLSTNQPDEWYWIFEGGDPASSSLQNPSVTYYYAGDYTVSLAVSNEGGMDYYEEEDYISVTEESSDITFNNTTFKDIDIEINGVEKVIPPDGSVTYYGLTGYSVDYYATTSGTTTTGTQVGHLLIWDNTIILDSPEIERDLVISSDYYFLFIENSGLHSFTPLSVGIRNVLSGFTADRTEYIVIPNDGVEYSIGYYESYIATDLNWIEIRAIWQDDPDWYSYWTQGSQFTLPWTENQSVTVYASAKKSYAESGSRDAAGSNLKGTGPGGKSMNLYPDYAVDPE